MARDSAPLVAAMDTDDAREAPWTVTEFFLNPQRYNPSSEILHKPANVSALRSASYRKVLRKLSQSPRVMAHNSMRGSPSAVLTYDAVLEQGTPSCAGVGFPQGYGDNAPHTGCCSHETAFLIRWTDADTSKRKEV